MVESKTCQECVRQINKIVKKNLRRIINHRNRCEKCKGCHRLEQVKESAKVCDKMGKE